MKLYEKYLTEAKSPKQMGKEIADQFMDDLDYSVKEYFGGWPDDVIGKSATNEVYKEIYKNIIKWAKDKAK